MSTTSIATVKKVMSKFSRNAELDEFLEVQLRDAGYGGAEIATSPVGTRITLYVQRPGLVIGRRGMGIKDLTERLEKKFMLPNPQISVIEEQAPELNPRIMCSRIAQTVIRGTAFRRAAIWALNSMMNAGAMGAEITISGKLRSERAHFEKYTAGVVPKSGDTAERSVRKATTDVLLKMGLYGVKVSIAIKDALPPEVQIKEAEAQQPRTTEEQVAGSRAAGEDSKVSLPTQTQAQQLAPNPLTPKAEGTSPLGQTGGRSAQLKAFPQRAPPSAGRNAGPAAANRSLDWFKLRKAIH